MFSFDATTVEPNAPREVIPAGIYTAHVIESELRDLKSGNGQAIALTFEILDGEFQGRRVWTNLNVVHTNEKAQAIGQQQLSALCRAINVMQVDGNTLFKLQSHPVRIKTKIRKDEQYGDKTEISGFEPVGGAAPVTRPATPSAPAPAAGGVKKNPWQK